MDETILSFSLVYDIIWLSQTLVNRFLQCFHMSYDDGDRSGPRILDIGPAIHKLLRFPQVQSEREWSLKCAIPITPHINGEPLLKSDGINRGEEKMGF